MLLGTALACAMLAPAPAAAGGSPIIFTKSFLDDPVPAGDTVTLEFALTNTTAGTTYEFIQFSDDLQATLAGLEALDTPQAGICGPDSTLQGVNELLFLGGELGPGESCFFTVTLRVPLEAAPGSYLNQTSGWSSFPFIGPNPVASDNLEVAAPAILTKEFIDDPVPAGSPVTLRFTLRNPDPSKSLTSIGFTDDLSAVLPGLTAVGLPQTGICGGGSSISGTTLLTFSGGSLVADASCTFEVTLSVPGGAPAGVHGNTTSSVSALLAGAPITGAPATDDLEVGIPFLTKQFTDDPVLPGGTVTLEFTIANVNPTQGFGGLSFSDDLDAVVPGLVALGLPILDPCGPGSELEDQTPMEGGGASVIGLVGGSLGAGGSCTFSVTLAVPGSAPAGDFLNLTSVLTIGFPAESGGLFEGDFALGARASDLLRILGVPSLAKSFTDDPVAPGEPVTLAFTIVNTDPVRRARNIAFSDNLGAALAGLSAPGLVDNPLLDVCGVGSQLAAGGGGINPAVLEFTGGDLAPGASCTFGVQLQVPGSAAPGSHTNTTSAISAEIGGRAGEPGIPVTGDPASDDLVVAALPVLTKTFTDDPVAPGGTVTLEFKITNTSTTDAATDLAFTDDLGTILPPAGFDGLGNPIPNPLIPQGLPLADPCGAGSQLISDTSGGSQVLTLTGGSLAAGAMCTFSVVLQVPANAPAGTYLNLTSPITGTIAAMAVEGGAASDQLTVVAVPRLSKSFTDDPASPGGTVTLQFTITHFEAIFNATQIAFTDDLTAVIPGLTAIGLPLTDPCGPGSRLRALGGDPTKLELFNGSLAPDAACTFDVTLQVPGGATPGSYPNTTSSLTATVGGVPVTRAPASDSLVIAGFVQLVKVITGSPAVPGGTLGLEFTLVNSAAGPAVSGLNFTDDLDDALTGMTATGLPLVDPCGAGSSLTGSAGNSFLTFSGGSLAPGGSCTFGVTLQVPGGAQPGQYTNVTSVVRDGASQPIAPPASAPFEVADVLSLLKSFTDDPVVPGGTVTLQFTVANAGLSPVTAIGFTDDLEAVLAGLTPLGLPLADPCGAGSQLSNVAGTLVLSNGSLAAQSSCVFSVSLQVPANAPFPTTRNNVTSTVTGQVGATPVEGPPATDKLRIAGIPVIVKEFTDDPAGPGGLVNLRFRITNANATRQATQIAFTDDLEAVLSGLVALGLPKSNVCGAGSQLNGTSVIALTGGVLAPRASCTINVSLRVPVGTLPGTYPNATSAVTADIDGTAVTGNQGTDNLVIQPQPLLEKSFADDPVAAGGTVTLEFTITNTDPDEPATAIAFSDDLDAVIPGLAATGTPLADVCGAGSQLAGTSLLTLTGGSLGPGGSCTFSVTLAVPAGAAPGVYPNVTSPVTAVILGVPLEGDPAADGLEIAPVPLLDKSFTNDPVAAGDTVTLEFTISHDEAVIAATNIGFTDDLDAVLPGLVALGLPISGICGPGSQLTGTSLLTLTGGSLEPGFSCTFAITLQVPGGAASGSYPNVTSPLTADVGGVAVESPPANDDLEIAGALSGAKEFTDDPVAAGGVVTLEFTLANSDLSFPITGITFTDDLDDVLPGLAAIGLPANDVCGAGSQLSGTSLLVLTGGNLPPGGSCVFSVSLQVPAGAVPSEYPNATSPIAGTIDGNPISAPPATDDLVVADQLSIAKSFTDDPVGSGGQVTLQFTIDYLAGPADAVDISFTDDLDATLAGLVAVGLPANDVCGAGSQLSGTSVLTLTGGTLPPGGSCVFSVTLQVPAGAQPGRYLNVTSDVTATVSGSPISGPPASDRLRVAVNLTFQKLTDGQDADLPPGPSRIVGQPVLWEYVITNSTGEPLTGIVVTDDQGVAVSCPADTLGVGQTLVCTGNGTVITGQYSNVGTVTALSGNRLVTATDPSNYFGVEIDFGDAPLPDYPTLLAADGARHALAGGVLGAAIDFEPDGQPAPAADGDDLAGIDDEDGVVFVDDLIAGGSATVDVTASAPGLLNAWIDFDANGDWSDAGEQVFVDQPLVAGVNSLTVTVPAAAAPGLTYARFRFDSGGGLGFTGLAADGEVEDYEVEVVGEADLSLAKSDVFDPLMAGKTQVYRLTVTNAGPSRAIGVLVEDTLPAGVFFLTAEPPSPQCLHAGGIVTCDLGMLEAGESAEARLVVLVGQETTGTITNSATVSSLAPDPDLGNNSASADSEVLPLRAMKALPDVNGNGSSDIATLESGSLVLRVFDAGTGAVISGAVFQPDFAPIGLTSVPSFADSPAPELVVLARRTTDGAVGVFARDALSGALVANHVLPADFRPFYVTAVPSFGGTPAWEVAVLGRRDSDGLVRVRVIDANSGVLLRAYNQSLQFFPLGFLPVPDFSGNGVWELATVGRRAVNQALRVSMHDASTGLVVSQWNTNHTFQPTGFGVASDVNGDGSNELVIVGRRNPDGAVRVWTRDSRTGAILALFGYPLAWLPLDLGIVPNFGGPAFDEAAVLRWRPSPADVRVTLKDTSNGAFLAGRLFDPTFQPLDLEIVPSYASGPANELAVWGERLSDGKQRIFLVDPQTGANLGFIPVP